MSRNPLNARDRAEQIIRGIGPDAQDHDAVAADIARSTDSPAPRQLDAGCIRSAYEAIAEAGERADTADDAVLVLLRSGARAAADAARVADEIGAGPGDALRAAARAWTPHQAPASTIDYAVTLGLRSHLNSVDAHQGRCPCHAVPRPVLHAAPSR